MRLGLPQPAAAAACAPRRRQHRLKPDRSAPSPRPARPGALTA
jgi:hypothetical protein